MGASSPSAMRGTGVADEFEFVTDQPDLYRLIVDSVPHPLAVLAAPDWRCVYANTAFRRSLTTSELDLTGRPRGELLSPAVIADFDQRPANRGPLVRRAVPLACGPANTWWDITYTPLGPPSGPLAGVLMTATDVTEGVLARRDAEDARAALDAVMAHIPAGLTIADANANIRRISAAGLAMLQRSADDVVGIAATKPLQIWSVHKAADQPAAEPNELPLVRAVQTGESVRSETWTLQRPDGTLLPILINAGPIRDADGCVIGGVSVWPEISQLVSVQQALQSSETELQAQVAQLEATYDSAPVGLCVVDRELRYRKVNARLAAINRCSVADHLGRSVREVIGARADVVEPLLQGVLDTGQPADSIEAIGAAPAPPFDTIATLASLQPVRGPRGEVVGVSAAIVDITERQRADAALRESEARLRAALEERELLVHEADHRIKNSLQLVAGVLNMQRDRLGDAEARAALDAAIARVLAVAEAHKAFRIGTDLRAVRLAGVLRDLGAHAALLNPAVAVRCSAPEELELDAQRAIALGLILSELLTNAAKYAYHTGASGSIDLAAEDRGGALEITVVDHGCGFEPGKAPTGLGNSIMQGLCGQIGATLELRSSPSNGTTAVLRLRR